METKTIAVGQLFVDVKNPRHGEVPKQADAIEALIRDQGKKLVALAEDIVEFGLNPLDRFLVLKSGRNYVVLEGNRRITAIKLLGEPGLAAGTDIAKRIAELAKTASPPTEVDCAIAASRQEGDHWLTLRHEGQLDGEGVVPWGSRAKLRHDDRPGTDAAVAVDFMEAVAPGFPENPRITELLEGVAEKRLTTLGRLVKDPEFRKLIGFEKKGDTYVSTFAAKDLEAVLEEILSDLAGDVGVSQLKTKQLRKTYLNKVSAKPKESARRKTAAPLASDPAPKKKAKKRKKKPKPPPKPAAPLADVRLDNLHPRLEQIRQEFTSLDIDTNPNTAGILLRVIIELAVDEVHDKQGWRRQGELRNRIKRCLKTIDPPYTDPKYQGVKAGLDDGSSIYSINTLHAFVHNTSWHPAGTEVRTFASRYAEFLNELNKLG